MPRQPRPVADGLVYHALNRGNNRAAVFFEPDDYALFLHALGQTQLRYPFGLFGYCLMTNHFHLLLGQTVQGGKGVRNRLTADWWRPPWVRACMRAGGSR